MTVKPAISRRDLIIGGAATLLYLPLASCNRDRDQREIVLFVTLALGNPFYVEMIRGLEAGIAASPPWLLEKQAGKEPDDASGQREIMEAFISRHSAEGKIRLKGLVLVPANSQLELTESIKLYNAAKIPVINLDIPVDPAALQKSGAAVNSFIGSDNVEGGRVAASEMAKQLPHGGNILILMGVPGQANTRARRDGFVERIGEIAKRTGASYTTQEWTANWSMSEAMAACDSLISGGKRINGIFAENDLMALGAARAVAGADWSGRVKPKVIGYDAIPDAVKAVQQGQIHATISQEPSIMGKKSIEYLARISKGLPVPPKEIVPVRLVTAEQPLG